MTDTTTAMQVFSGGERKREREKGNRYVRCLFLRRPNSASFISLLGISRARTSKRDEGGRDWSR